jgi:hypothetical protein
LPKKYVDEIVNRLVKIIDSVFADVIRITEQGRVAYVMYSRDEERRKREEREKLSPRLHLSTLTDLTNQELRSAPDTPP